MEKSSHNTFDGPRGDFSEQTDIATWSDESSASDSGDESGEDWTCIEPRATRSQIMSLITLRFPRIEALIIRT